MNLAQPNTRSSPVAAGAVLPQHGQPYSSQSPTPAKQHFNVLDGLRGTAALLVVVFHLLLGQWKTLATNPLHHAHLAVDFFFLLSGFVIGYAYDKRLATLKPSQFFRIRVTRLQPLVLLGALFGLVTYRLDPFARATQHVDITSLGVTFLLVTLLLPSPPLPNRADETHSLNGASWSLLEEYLANWIYSLVGPLIGRKALTVLVALSAIALTAAALSHGNLHGGWGWRTLWMGPVRVTFSFFAGLLLFRSGWRLSIPAPFVLLSLALAVIIASPIPAWNGLYEAFCVIVLFPLIVATGAGSGIKSGSPIDKLSKFSGRISYPLYILHCPFMYIFQNWIAAQHPPLPIMFAMMGVMVVFFIALSYIALRFYDEPVRAWLTKRAR